MALTNQEETVKKRFFSNTRVKASPSPQPTASAIPHVQADHMEAFINEMQTAMKAQSQGTIAGQLLTQQAKVMEQQVEILKANQTAQSKVIDALASQPAQHLTFETLLRPLVQQVKEMNVQYTESKITANQIQNQIKDLQTAVVHQTDNADTLRQSVAQSLERLGQQKSNVHGKVAEANYIVTQALESADQTLNMDKQSKAIEHLRQQMEVIQRETEHFETELTNRYKRVLTQGERLKAIPKEHMFPTPDFIGVRTKVAEGLGGPFDYESFLSDMDSIRTEKNRLLLEFRQTAIVYPKYTPPKAPAPENSGQRRKPSEFSRGGPKRTTPRTLPSYPSTKPSTAATHKFTSKKPTNLINLPSNPIDAPPEERKKTLPTPQPAKPDLDADIFAAKNEKHQVRAKPDRPAAPVAGLAFLSADDETPLPSPKPITDSKLTTLSAIEVKSANIIKPENLISPEFKIPTSTIQTQEPPIPNLDAMAVDILTDFLLANRLGTSNEPIIPMELRTEPSKWLGVNDVNELIRAGLPFDTDTIEKIGREVLADGIAALRSDIEYEKSNRKGPAQAGEVAEEIEDDEAYSQSFDEYSSEASVEPGESTTPRPSKPIFTEPESAPTPVLGTTPMHVDANPIPTTKVERLDIATSPKASSERGGGDLSQLLNPRILGAMNAAAVSQYVTSLISSGHLQGAQHGSFEFPQPHQGSAVPQAAAIPPQQPVSEQHGYSGSLSATPRVPTPAPSSTNLPPELEAFFSSPAGRELYNLIQSEKGQVNPQQIMEQFTSQVVRSPRSTLPLLNIHYKPGSEQADPTHTSKEDHVFGKVPVGRKHSRLDLSVEARRVEAENAIMHGAVTILPHKLPALNLYPSICGLTESEDDLPSASMSIGSEIFASENPDFLGGFVEYVRKAQGLEEGQMVPSGMLSDGEIRFSSSEVSSGEVSVMTREEPLKLNISTADLMSEDGDYASSVGEFDPYSIFKV